MGWRSSGVRLCFFKFKILVTILGIVQTYFCLPLVTIDVFCQFVCNKAKGRISKQVFQEHKARQIFRKTIKSYPLIRTRAWVSWGKECSFFGKFGVLCFLETPVLRFALLPYYRRILIFRFSIREEQPITV